MSIKWAKLFLAFGFLSLWAYHSRAETLAAQPLENTVFTSEDDTVMFSVPTGVKFKLWFAEPVDCPVISDWLRIKRTRREGGPVWVSGFINRSAWIKSQVDCFWGVEDALPRSGHYSYEIQLCSTPDEGSCSTWSSSLDTKVARVRDTPRAWWVYGYLAPTGVPSF